MPRNAPEVAIVPAVTAIMTVVSNGPVSQRAAAARNAMAAIVWPHVQISVRQRVPKNAPEAVIVPAVTAIAMVVLNGQMLQHVQAERLAAAGYVHRLVRMSALQDKRNV